MVVQKKAQELADAIVNSAEYQNMLEARAEVNEHEAAKVMLRDFQAKQVELHEQQMKGQPITKEQEEALQQLFGVISVNPYVRKLFETEFAFSGMMMQVNEELAKVLDPEPEEVEAEGPKLVEVPKKKILIPGQDD